MTTHTFQAETFTKGWGSGYAEKSNSAKATEAWKHAAQLDILTTNYRAKGNFTMAKVCRERALGAANRAIRYA
jgi:hypothetical protein